MALAERIILTPKFPGRIIKVPNQNRELKAALDETKLLLKDHRQQCLKIMDLSTSPAFQPVFIKFWQLFLQLRQQEEFTSGESGRCTLPAGTYLSAMELVKKALGSAMATEEHLLQLQNQDTEVSYKRFCYDFVCCLGDEVLEISPAEYRLNSFEATLRIVFKACTRVRDLKVELREVEGAPYIDVQCQWNEKSAKEVNASALKLPSLIETITRMSGTAEDRLVGRRPTTTAKTRHSSMTHSVPKSQPVAPTAREIQIHKLNSLRRQLSITAQELSSLTALSVASPGLAPKYTPRTEFSAPPSSGVMFTSLRNDTTSRKVMTKRMIRFAFPKSPKQPGNQNLKLKGRKVRGSSVPQHNRDSTSRGQQVTLDSHPDLNYQSFDTQKINRTSNSRMKLKNEDQRKEYVQEACLSLVSEFIAGAPEPPGYVRNKVNIVQICTELETLDKRGASAAHKLLEQIGKCWSAETLKEVNFEQKGVLDVRPVSPTKVIRIRSVKRPEPEPEENGRVFGFLSKELYDELQSYPGSIRPSGSIQQLEASFNAVHISFLRPHFEKIIDFLELLSTDRNVKTRECVLSLCHQVLSFRGISIQVNLLPHVDILLPKFADVNIRVRQAVFKCIRAILRELRLVKLLPHLSAGLKTENWHQREEILKLFIVSMLAVDEAQNVDFLEIVPVVAPLMDDETPKVRYVALETLCVLARQCGNERVEKELQPMMDDLALELLRARFARMTLPVVKDETVEFPRETPLSAPVTMKSISHPPPGPKTPSAFTFAGLESTSTTASLFPTQTQSVQIPVRTRNMSSDTTSAKQREVQVLAQSSSLTTLRPNNRRGPRARLYETMSFLQAEQSLQRNSSVPSLKEKEPTSRLFDQSTTYLKPEEIQAPENSSDDLNKVMRGLQAIEWAEQFETLNLIRKLLKFNPDSLRSGNLSEVIRQVVTWAESLRSSLSKNAIIVLGEMCESVPRSLEGDLDQLLSLLLRKSVDTNMFLSEVATRSLDQMCQHMSDGRLITCLLNNVSTIRSSLVKAKTAYCFEMLMTRLKGQFPKSRDFGRVMKILSDYALDASAEVRTAAKKAIQRLAQEIPQDEIDRYMIRILPPKVLTEFQEGMKHFEPPVETQKQISSARDSNRKEGAVRRLVIRSSRHVESKQVSESEQLQEVAAEMQNPVWKQRYDAVSKAASMALQTATDPRSSTVTQTIECLCIGISDLNIKVSYHSVSALKKLLEPLQTALNQHLPAVVLALSQTLSTGNMSLKSIAIEVLAHLIGHADVSASLPSLVNAFGQVSGKGKIGVLKLITELLPSAQTKELLHRHVVPMSKVLLSDWRPELEREAVEFLKQLDALIELGEVLNDDQMSVLKSKIET